VRLTPNLELSHHRHKRTSRLCPAILDNVSHRIHPRVNEPTSGKLSQRIPGPRLTPNRLQSTALMDGDAVAVVVRLMRGGDVAGSEEEEYCISALYGMSRGSMRFCGLALVAGVKAVLQPVAEGRTWRSACSTRCLGRTTRRRSQPSGCSAGSGIKQPSSISS
jgi:hypothetical protein